MSKQTLPKPDLPKGAAFNVAHQYVAAATALIHGLALVPLYLARIPVDLYGAWLATAGVLAWMDLIDPGLSGALQQRVASRYGAADASGLRETVGTGLLMSLALSTACFLTWPLAAYLPQVVGVGSSHADTLVECFHLSVIATSVSFASYAVTSTLVGLHLSLAAGLIFTLGAVAGLATTVGLLLAGFGLPAIPLGLLAKSGIVLSGGVVRLTVWWLRSGLPPPRVVRAEGRIIRDLLGYTLAARMGAVLSERMEALLVAWAFTPNLAVVYVLSGRAFEPLKMLTTRLAYGLTPSISHLSGSQNHGRARAVVNKALTLVSVVATAGVATVISLNESFVSLWVGRQFFGGNGLTVALGAATGASILASTTSHFVFALGGIRRVAAVSLGEGLLRTALVALTIQWLGIVSLPLSTCLASATVSFRYLPKSLAVLLRRSEEGAPSWHKQVGAGAAMILLGGLLAFAQSFGGFAGTWDWPTFVLAAAGVGSGFLALSFGIYRTLGRLDPPSGGSG